MDNAYFCRLIGPINIDAITKQGGGGKYEFKAQHPAVIPYGPKSDKTAIDYTGKVWTTAADEIPKQDDVVHVDAIFLAFAEPYIYAQSFAIFCRGDLPSNFEVALPTVIALGQVTSVDKTTRSFGFETGDYHHEEKKRVTVPMTVYLLGKQFDYAKETTVGSLVVVVGSVYNQAAVSMKWGIDAKSIHYLPFTGQPGSTPATPIKKRKYERKGIFVPDDKEQDNNGEGSSVLTPGPSSGRGRSTAART
ncbi:hypothetical protein CF326_g1309 [Tilletia indica]|nr:hypothetical protein CF326_g1309 [Tilletia indica]